MCFSALALMLNSSLMNYLASWSPLQNCWTLRRECCYATGGADADDGFAIDASLTAIATTRIKLGKS